MGWYKRSKLVYETFRNVSSKLVTKNPILLNPPNTPKFNSNCCYSFYNQHKSYGFFGSPSISSKFRNLSGFKKDQSSLISGVTRRYYYVDRNQVDGFKRRCRRLIRNLSIVFIVLVVGFGAMVITIRNRSTEVVPYTKRKHFVLLSRTMERLIGQIRFILMKEEFEGKILPATHPESIRVRLIAKDIIEALQRGTTGLSHEHVWGEPSYASEVDSLVEHSELQGDEGGLDDKRVVKSRKKAVKPATHHLEGLNWEVLVVDDPHVNAFCLPGGKIVVFTGLLKHLQTDPEIAIILGHEVGHAVARHLAETLTINMLLASVLVINSIYSTPDLVTMAKLFLRRCFSQRMEMEADYIGLLLVAFAGYDPRVAPLVYEKLGKVTSDAALRDYLSTHPSEKTRAQLHARVDVMEEALKIYLKTIAVRRI